MNTTGNRYPEEISQATKSLRFKTKKGHCYMLDDRIVIIRNRKISLERAFDICWWSRVKIGVFLITAGFSLIRAFFEFPPHGHIAFSALYLISAFLFGYLGKRQIESSLVKIIYKKDILSADFYGARFGRKKSFFEVVHYENEILKCTHIEMPKKNTSGGSNTQKALEIMYHVMD